MQKITFLLVFLAFSSKSICQNIDAMKMSADKAIDNRYSEYKNLALQIWQHAELGYQETKSSAALQSTLKANGFEVKAGVADMPTAFVATYGSGKPVIGILAEFDALPGLAQEAEPTKKFRKGAGGHGCGHHLFGVASMASAIELKNQLQANKLSGTIKIYGTPAEEGGGGKVYMVRAGLLEGVDVVMHWHPASSNAADAASSLANISAKFRFRGQAAHAAASPDRGRSALDGVEAMNNMVNMMREHIPQETRIHYVITDGGKAPNVVPDYAEVYYYVRHPNREICREIFDRLNKCANGAAMGTETNVEMEVVNGVYDLLPIVPLAKQMHNNLTRVGGVTYNETEKAFGLKIQESFPAKDRPSLEDASKVEPFVVGRKGGSGSTDVGDVSWVVPTVGLRTATWTPGTAAHSWQAVACGGTEIGTKGMMVAAKTLTGMGLDLFTDPKLIEAGKAEFDKARGTNFQYKSLAGDRKPPLDYRNASSGGHSD